MNMTRQSHDYRGWANIDDTRPLGNLLAAVSNAPRKGDGRERVLMVVEREGNHPLVVCMYPPANEGEDWRLGFGG